MSRNLRRFAVALAVLTLSCAGASNEKNFAAQGTSSAPPSTTGSASSPTTTSAIEGACDAYAAHYCAALASSSKAMLASLEGDADQCKTSWRSYCLRWIAPAASNTTPATIAACGAAQIKDPNAVLDQRWDACVVPGRLPDGAPCAQDAECAGTFCDRPEGASCGVCARSSKVGETCAKGKCEGGLSCVQNKCEKPPSAGQACGTMVDCAYPTFCSDGKCTAPARLGETCDPLGDKAPQCNMLEGLVCVSHPDDSGDLASTCVPWKLAKTGERCADAATNCEGNSHCVHDMCVRYPDKGEACDRKTRCLAGLSCVKGTCAALEASQCAGAEKKPR